ncbi:MAG TPA: phosphodiesterase [Candidatus Hydrogenedentes bacterium]|nr:phosphodiesterase [Candidatus Hydrogenedentota bacterium]
MERRRVDRVLVIGLDCATPQFVFGPERFDLPNLHELMRRGCWGRLESCHPPITVPAWSVMTAGKDPGTLGFYGFRNRRDYSYDPMVTANATAVRDERVWDILSRNGKKVVVLGVPQTYPPNPVNGWLVSGFLAPDTRSDYAYPKSLKREIEAAAGEYVIDVKDFRTDDKDGLLERLYALMANRFAIARFLIEQKPWDFFMMVEMGLDRLHHGFWKFCANDHPMFQPGNPYENVIRDFYRSVDREVGGLLDVVGDETAILVVSDHGAKSMRGGICVNQWLVNNGLLTLHDRLDGPKRIEDCHIDWAKTSVWSSGGYYARMFFNVKGREPQGVIPPDEYEAFRDQLAEAIKAMPDHNGEPLRNRVVRPQEVYRAVNGVAPDLIVYFGDLAWRAVGPVGFENIYTFENDTGPDDANHDCYGIFIMDDRVERGGREVQNLHLMDVAPTILDLLGVEIPEDMQGKVITGI